VCVCVRQRVEEGRRGSVRQRVKERGRVSGTNKREEEREKDGEGGRERERDQMKLEKYIYDVSVYTLSSEATTVLVSNHNNLHDIIRIKD
jgi:hypothetical protein